MRKQLTIGLIILLCVLSGCTKDRQDITSTNTTKEHLTREVTDAKEYIIANIDADVIYPDATDLPVVTLKKIDFTSEDIKKMVNIFYGNSEYHRALDPCEYSVEQLHDAITEYELDLEEIEQLYNDNDIDINNYMSYLSTCNYELASLNEHLKDAPTEVDTSTILDFYDRTIDYYTFSYDEEDNIEYISDVNTSTSTVCNLEGTYNSMPCSIEFWDKSGLYIRMDASDTLVWKSYTNKEVEYNYDELYHSYNSIDSSIENECVYSTEQAINMCNDIIKELGLSDMSVMDIRHTPLNAYEISPRGYRYGDPIDTGYCGYELYYGRSVNNVNQNMYISGGSLYTSIISKMDDDDFKNLPSLEGLYFTITDAGIISMTYYNPSTIQDITSTNTTILDIDTIISLADIYLPIAYDESAGYCRETFNITQIQLGLMEVPSRSSDSDTTLIPVWDFYTDNEYISVLTINAIDGNRLNRVTGAVAN